MPRDYIPAEDAKLLTYTANFSSIIAVDFASLGLTSAQSTSYAATQGAFASAYAVVQDGMTRSPGNIILKDQAKANLVFATRQLAGIIQKNPGTTNAQREALKLTIRADPTPIPQPTAMPDVDIVGVNGRIVTINVHDSEVIGRLKPPGVKGAMVFAAVAPVAPTDPTAYVYQGMTGRSKKIQVQFPATAAPGAQVWIAAAWCAANLKVGPLCEPRGANLQFGPPQMNAAA